MCGEERNCNCIGEILRKIIILQRSECDNTTFAGCDKPFLGPTLAATCYNTRPVQLYNCCTGTPWTFSYTLDDGTTGTTSDLRVESLDECCCTCRLLYEDATAANALTNTGQFVTIDLKCCGAIRCLPDTSIDLC